MYKAICTILQIPIYCKPDYKHTISSKLDTSDPTPSVHRPRNDIDELVCDEVIHYHSRYKHNSRPHSAPAKRLSHHVKSLRPLPHSGSNISKHFLLEHDQDLHKEGLQVTESSFENTSGDK